MGLFCVKFYETAYLKHCVFYLIFSENDIALIEDGSEHSLNPIILTDDDIRKIEDEENFEKVYDESRKIRDIKYFKDIEEESTDRRKSKLNYYIFKLAQIFKILLLLIKKKFFSIKVKKAT